MAKWKMLVHVGSFHRYRGPPPSRREAVLHDPFMRIGDFNFFVLRGDIYSFFVIESLAILSFF